MRQQYTHHFPLALVSVAAPEDAELLERWERHLRPLEQAGLISLWSVRHLIPGVDWVQEVQRQLVAADLVLLLLSADFFSSPDCLATMEQALERSRTGAGRVIPLLLRPAIWQESPLAGLAPWPPDGVPITMWTNQDAAWDACVLDLRRLLGRRVSPALPGGSPAKHIDPDWERMLRRLRRSYKELLDQSLHGIAWVELGLSTRPDMVSNMTNLLFRLPQGGERQLAPGTSILDAFDEAEEELLILGGPGAGKSTLLLELAQQLVGRAIADPAHPLPVILRLSSWAVRRPTLDDWMVEQLSRTYDVPHLLSERWVRQGRLLPLLDGLDEMEEATRPACIAAINDYHRTRLIPLVVCSRQAEYETAASKQRLVLQEAVIVQPLSEAQIATTLQEADPSFAGLQAAWSQEPALRELATNPLMLSVQMLAYRDRPSFEIVQQGAEGEQRVWMDYVKRQISEKGNDARYPLEQVYAWLSWLARQMSVHQQTTFYAEYLDTDWLVFKQQRTAIRLATEVPVLLISVCTSLLVQIFLRSVGFGSVLSAQLALIGGGVGMCMCQYLARDLAPHRLCRSPERRIPRSLVFAVSIGVLLAVSQGLSFISIIYTFGDWIRDGILVGLGGGLGLWWLQTGLSGSRARPRKRKKRHSLWERSPLRRMVSLAPLSVWQAVAQLGGIIGLSWGLIRGLGWLLNGSSFWQSGVLSLASNMVLSQGLSVGLSVSVTAILIYVILERSMGPLRLAERISWNWHRALHREHLRTNLATMSMLLLFIGLSVGLQNALEVADPDKLRFGLSFGLGFGLILALSYLILLGLYQGITQEHLEDQNRQQFNQGVRRSLRNGLLLALVSTSIITCIGILGSGLSEGLSEGLSMGFNNSPYYGMSNGLNYGLSYGLSEVQVFFFASLVIMWALSGGLTVLRHYVIRWLLARHRLFPWRAQAFLDDATSRILLQRVGGGYSFIHRRLQDYFADGTASPPQE